MFDWVNNLWNWIVNVFNSTIDFLSDLPVNILHAFLSSILSVLNLLDFPQVANGLQGIIYSFAQSDAGIAVLYFMSRSGIAESLGFVAVGFSFRMMRKLVTLFQW